MTIKNEMNTYIMDEFWDSRLGGFYTSINQSKADLVTDDKMLKNIALGLITYSKLGEKEAISTIMGAVEDYKDAETEGYVELLDASNAVHPIGVVKTVSNQILMGYALWMAGSTLGDEKLKEDSLAFIEFVADKYFKTGYPKIFDRNWDRVIDDSIGLSDISAVCYVLSKVNRGDLISKDVMTHLFKFIDDKKGAFSYLDKLGNAVEMRGKNLADMAFLSIVLIELADKMGESRYTNIVLDTFRFVLDNMKCSQFGGFWNKCDTDGRIVMNPLEAYYNKKESPFPYKSVLDEAVLLIAAKKMELLVDGEGAGIIKEIVKITSHTLGEYYDKKSFGFFLGKSSWFSGPSSPSVPLARLAMVPQHTPGAFAVGNTLYVQLQQKQMEMQCIGLLATMDMEFNNPTDYKFEYLKEDVDNTLTYITKGKLEYKQFDLDGYLNWSMKTRNGMAYGLTPYRSPLGFRSDKSPQNFSAMHVISDMLVLGKEIENPSDLLKFMYSSQNTDGGFGEEPSMISEVFTTYCVVVTAFLLKDDNYDKESCIRYLQECQNEDGGFGNAPGYPSDSWHTNLAVMSLHLLDATAKNEDKLINYLLACRNEDGGYAIIPGAESDTFSVFRAVDSLMLLNVKIPEKEKTVKWIQKMQDNSGGFIYKENQFVSFVGSYHAIAALYIMGELPEHVEECKQWLSDHQMKDGGMSRSISGPSDTTDEGFITIQALHMLERKLNPYWVRIVT